MHNLCVSHFIRKLYHVEKKKSHVLESLFLWKLLSFHPEKNISPFLAEVWFLEESYKNMQKKGQILIVNILRVPCIQHSGSIPSNSKTLDSMVHISSQKQKNFSPPSVPHMAVYLFF